VNDDEMRADSVHTCVCGATGGQVFHVITSAPEDTHRTWVRDRFWCPPNTPCAISATAQHQPAN
jgi:hypothetical protein